MTVKVGQIRKDSKGLYIITSEDEYNEFKNYNEYCVIYYDGIVYYGQEYEWIEKDKLIAEYPTWQEAVNSPEFKGEM